ncbi:MAG TPA: aminoacyl-tRNA hydrolase, partial [Candidatus Paceibacterota bacterium]
MWIIVGLGNPGEGYEMTRHNTGRMVVEAFAKKHAFSDWKKDATLNAQIAKGKIETAAVTLMLPDTFMNKSGGAVKKMVKNVKQAERVIAVYDDLDLPLGTIRLSFGRGSGGHRGIESIITSLRTKNFMRIRVGVSPQTPGGKLKKPKGDEQVLHFILDPFSKKEMERFKKVEQQAGEALAMTVTEGRVRA